MSDTYNYEVLEPGGHARLVGNVLDRISEASANHASAVGSSRAMLGDPETASWMGRTTAADGAALIESVRGNTLRWNQICTGQNTDQAVDGITRTATASGGITLVGTVTTAPEYNQLFLSDILNFKRDGRKYLIKASKDVGAPLRISGYTNSDSSRAFIWSATASSNWGARISAYAPVGTELNVTDLHISVFDLTAMFGAGNEPSTVAEFEELYPLPYYPYDAGSLLPVRMEGVETTGFNQWDEEWESGTISSTTGQNGIDSSVWRTKNYIPVLSGATYYATGTPVSGTDGNMRGRFYAADKTYISDLDASNQSLRLNRAFTVPSGARFLRFAPQNSQIVDKRICINISDPSRNGIYEPYWSSQRTIPASTYFPQGLRSAGSVRDELTATQAITRVGERAYQSGDESDASVITDGTVTHYALATPTTTPIDPPLPMSYRTGAGGTERVMVASGTTSAPPVFATRYPLDPADLAASIAPVDGPTAKTNHQVGDLLMLGFTLCKATQVIVTGETIAIGTNVTKTTVAAELAAISE